MKKTISTLAAGLLLFAAACSSNAAPEQPAAPAGPASPAPEATVAAVDPAGMYDFIATMGAQTRTGTLEIRNEPQGIRGEAWLEGESDPAIIGTGSVTGNHVVLDAYVGNGMDVTFALDFTGSSFTGTISAGGDVIDVTGTRRP